MRYTIIIIPALFAVSSIIAQNVKSNVNVSGTTSGTQVSISDINGRPFKAYDQIEGSAFFINEAKPSDLKLNGGQKVKSVCRIDLYSNEVHFINADGAEFSAPAGLVTEVRLYTALPDSSAQMFRCGYPTIDKLSNAHFYLVLEDGPFQLLKSITKRINTKKDDVSGEVSRSFEEYEDYYVYHESTMLKLRRERTFFESLMQDKKREVGALIEASHLNLKKIDDIAKIFSWYNAQSSPKQ
jgi:hypothetical protein